MEVVVDSYPLRLSPAGCGTAESGGRGVAHPPARVSGRPRARPQVSGADTGAARPKEPAVNRTIPWGAALRTGSAALVAVLAVEMLAGLAWMQGVTETGSDTPIESTLQFFPGSVVRYGTEGAGFQFGWTPGYLCLVVAVVAVLGRVLIRGAGRVPDPAR